MRTLNPNTLERVENYITEYQKKNGKSPSYRQIMHGVGMSSLNLVQRYVLALEREGRIERTRIGNISVPPKLKPSGVAIAPLVGSIACGQPVDAVENIEESFALPRSIFGNGDLFMLRTFGDSMIDIGSVEGKIQNFLLQKMDFTEHYVDRDIISQFVDTVIPRSETCYEWYMDFDLIEKPNEKKKMVWSFKIDYNEAKTYRKEREGMLRPNQWEDLIVRVYI